MKMGFLSNVFLISLTLLSTASCNHNNHDQPDHHGHSNHHKDVIWQNFLPPGVFLENVTSSTASSNEDTINNKEYYTPESTSDVTNSEATQVTDTSLVQNGTVMEEVKDKFKIGLSFLISVPIVSLLVAICLCYCLCKCCLACCESDETPGVVVMQSNTVQPAPAPVPEIIVQQHVPPPYEAQQKNWAAPPPQWAPHPMNQQPQYSPNAYENPNFTYATAPPQYNHQGRY